MRAIGRTLMVVGAAIGFSTGIAMLAGWDPLHLPWLLAVGFVKLVLLAALGMMGAGALMLRLGRKAEMRRPRARTQR